jgi:tetratricopeptide (TPR) repeat protein
MRRRLNVKGLCALVGCIVLFGVLAHLLHGYQVKRQAGSLLKQADRAEHQKQYRLARDYMRRYLGFQLKDTDTLARYGRLLARDVTTPQAGFRAIAVLESVLRRDPTRAEERRLVIDLSFRLESYKDAQYHIEFLLGLNKDQDARQQLERVLKADPKKRELVSKLAACHAAQGRYLQARACYEAAVDSAPGERANVLALARLLREQTDVLRVSGDREKRETPASLHRRADQLLENLVKANPGSASSYVARAQYRRRYPLPEGREATLKEVESDLRQALKLAPDDADVLLDLADLAIDRNQPEQARDFLLQGLARHQKDWRMYEALSRLERGVGHPDDALSLVREGLKELPDQLELLWEHAELLVAIGSSEATDAIGRLEKKGVPQAERDVLSASVLLRKREWTKALQLLLPAHARLIGRANIGRSPFAASLLERCNLLLAQCYERLGDPYRAQNAYQRILANHPRSAEARLGMARTHTALGQVREAESQYRQLARLPNGHGAWVEVARLVLQRNLREDQPNWEEVDDSLKVAEGLRPRPLAVALLRAEALSAQAEVADAARKKQLQEEARAVVLVNLLGGLPVFAGLMRPEMLPVAAFPQNRSLAALWTALSALEERAGRPEAALRLLAEADKRFGDLVELRQARMRYWARQRGPGAGRALAALEQGLDRFPPEERHQLRTSLALAYTSLGQAKRARGLWEALARDRRDDWAVRLVLFNQALERNDEPALNELLSQLRAIEKEDGVLWRDATVRHLLVKAARLDRSVERKGLLNEARKLTAEIATRWPGWLGVTQFEAQIEDLDGRPDKALAKYRAVIDKGGANMQAVWRAMEILNSQQRFREASALRAKLPRGPFAAGLEQVAALASLQANDNAQALTRAEDAVAQAPRDFRTHLLLGQIYWRMGKLDKALSSLSKARDLGERVPETWVALIGFLAATDRKERASAELARAETKLVDLQGRLALAQCYDAVGETEKAGAVYTAREMRESTALPVRRAVAAYYLRSGNTKAAKDHLAFLVKAAETKEPETVVWARGMQAILAALGGKYTEMREVLGRLEQSGSRESSAGVEGRRAQAVILATRGNRRDRLRAVELVQKLIDEGRDQPPDRLLLAQLHEANNDWRSARKQLSILWQMAGGNADAPQGANISAIQVAYISAMLRHGEVEEAEAALGRLEKVPSAAGTLPFVSLQAQLRHRQGKEKEAVRLLQDHARQHPQAFVQVALVLEGLREHQAAEQMYKAYGGKSTKPADVLAHAGFLSRQKRYEEALDVCERAWAKCPAEVVANTCLGILQAAAGDNKVQTRVGRQFQVALKKNADSVPLRHALANLRVLQRRYDDAETTYRELIALDRNNVLARNNLAWILACQKKRISDAAEMIDEAIALAGPRETLLDTQALVFLAAGKTKEAVRLLEGLAAGSPKVPGYHFHLALAYLADQNPSDAARSLKRARRVGFQETSLHPLERPGYEQLVRAPGIARK